MEKLATLTMNPAVDMSYEVDRMVDTHKMRARAERYSPGGGGINVARIFIRLGETARCYYPAGGPIGEAFQRLVDAHGLPGRRFAIAGTTRVSTTVLERSTGREFRLVPEGPQLAAQEWQDVLEAIAEARCEFLVASGSLPRGVPDDFYARIAAIAGKAGIRFVLDSSGRGLAGGLARGGVEIVKPSLGELGQLAGRRLEGLDEIRATAAGIVRQGQAKIVTVTMGHRGAILVSGEGSLYLPAPPVEAVSAVGAGDSFVAGMIFKLANGADLEEAFRFAMAAGTAAVCTPGTEMSRPEDIPRFLADRLDGIRTGTL